MIMSVLSSFVLLFQFGFVGFAALLLRLRLTLCVVGGREDAAGDYPLFEKLILT